MSRNRIIDGGQLGDDAECVPATERFSPTPADMRELFETLHNTWISLWKTCRMCVVI